jgi:hypothetical protein
MEPNFVTLNTPYYRRLSDSQIQTLHDSTLEVLERTGIRILEGEALQLFKEGGADITDGTRVRIPAWRVEWAIKTAPNRLFFMTRGSCCHPFEKAKLLLRNGSDPLTSSITGITSACPGIREISVLMHCHI